MIYLDTSALVKLVFEEDESSILEDWLAQRGELPKVSSDVAVIELLRTARRYDRLAVSTARQVLSGLDLVPVAGEVLELASFADPQELRSLDAIHLASALALGDALTSFVAYDVRLLHAATVANLAVVSPT